MGIADFAGGVQAELKALITQRLLQQQQAIENAQKERQLGQSDRQLGQGDRRIDLDEGEFGFKQKVFADEAPNREAGRLYTTAQTADLQRKPAAEEAARTFNTTRDATQHGFRLGEINAQGEQARQTKTTPDPGDVTPAATQSPFQTERQARTLQSVDELLGKVTGKTVGYGNLLAGLPESDARNFAAEVDTLKSAIIQGELTAMREASKTGGALGQVSDREANFLAASLGALDLRQSPANFTAQLQKVKASIERWQAAQGLTPIPSHGDDGGVVSMVAPDGRPLSVPADKVAEMEAKGAKRR